MVQSAPRRQELVSARPRQPAARPQRRRAGEPAGPRSGAAPWQARPRAGAARVRHQPRSLSGSAAPVRPSSDRYRQAETCTARLGAEPT